MEWYLNIFGEWRSTGYTGAGRTVKKLLMTMAFCMALSWIGVYTVPAEKPEALRNDEDAAGGSEDAVQEGAIGNIIIPEILEIMPDKITSDAERTAAEKAVSSEPENLSVPDCLTVSEMSAVTDISSEPEAPAATETPTVPDTSVLPEMPVVPETPAEPDTPAVPETPIISETPEVPDNSENASSSSGTVGGFMVDENGIIYGVADPELAISGGVMTFPSEDCCGISAGAFSEGFPAVLEVHIPTNITKIEPGAFAGLVNVEWYTAEPGSGFSDKMGVLLSDDGTTIFAFPCGRTGSYKVPAEITGFAQNAFADACITALDMTECTVEAPSGLPDHIEVIQREAY